MCPALLETEERCLGGMTFFAQSHPVELCGTNGLPVTPKSITIYGKAQLLMTIKHPNLSSYLDIIRSKHERTVIVAEFSGEPLSNIKNVQNKDALKISFQCLLGLQHMHKLGLIHRYLSPDNILIDKDYNVQLYNFGMYYMTDNGRNVSFPIGYPKYTAPEVFLSNGLCGNKVDSWSLGIIAAELFLGQTLWPGIKLGQCLRKSLSLIHCQTSIFERLARENNCYENYMELSEDIKCFVDSCLQIRSSKRKTINELINLPVFKELYAKSIQDKEENTYNNIITRKMEELYYLWQLAGGDISVELKRQGLIRSRPPILSIPNLVILLGQMFGRRDSTGLLDLRVVKVPLNTLRQRLSDIPYIANYPRLTNHNKITELLDYAKGRYGYIMHAKAEVEAASSQLPLIIRERDTEYQFHRIVLYNRLLQIYPITRDAIIKEAHKDIPPPVRGAVWAALLEITGDIQKKYDMIDKETPTHTDRQIEVDIPRCHQYSEILSSGTGHKKLQRLLKAWVRDNPHYVYWQGLDSLTAPFLYLNFNDEARAFACLSAFIPKYLHKFFLKDNSAVIQEYLAKFFQIIRFYDPQLANHLQSINFVPELFAIPWFLTMFSHVFPLHKILHLWDKLLLGDSSFPLLVGVAILKQLRDSLLTSAFNECILLFSDLPEIDIEQCVKDSMLMYQKTPTSITYRKHQFNQALNWVEPEPGTEKMPRISIEDFLNILHNNPDKLTVVDLRNKNQYDRGAVLGSINIPFSSVQLSHTNVESQSLQVKRIIENKEGIVVIVGPNDQNNFLFSEFLVKLNVVGVCSLQGGIYALRSKCPNILSPLI